MDSELKLKLRKKLNCEIDCQGQFNCLDCGAVDCDCLVIEYDVCVNCGKEIEYDSEDYLNR